MIAIFTDDQTARAAHLRTTIKEQIRSMEDTFKVYYGEKEPEELKALACRMATYAFLADKSRKTVTIRLVTADTLEHLLTVKIERVEDAPWDMTATTVNQ